VTGITVRDCRDTCTNPQTPQTAPLDGDTQPFDKLRADGDMSPEHASPSAPSADLRALCVKPLRAFAASRAPLQKTLSYTPPIGLACADALSPAPRLP
jgi:hypothetical protein